MLLRMNNTAAPNTLTAKRTAPGQHTIYNGKRSIGTIRKADFRTMYTVRFSGQYIGQASTVKAALAIAQAKVTR